MRESNGEYKAERMRMDELGVDRDQMTFAEYLGA